MRIESLHIDGFGHFTNCDLGPFDAGLSVVHGHNEAGKSTLLAFIRTVLFGFPAQKRADHYPALNGGRHGGRLVVIDEAGERYTIERFEDARGQTLRVVLPGGTAASDESVLARLLGNASRSLFEAVFGFGLRDLQKIESIEKGEASRQIYAAGLGAANLPAVRSSLTSEAEDIFLPRGSRQELAKLLKELEAIDVRLGEVKGQAAEYARCTDGLRTLELERERVAKEIEEASVELREFERLQAAWDDWVLRGDLKQQLSAIPASVPFPPEGVRRLEELQRNAAETEAACSDLRAELRALEEKAGAPVSDQPLLECGADAEEMRRQRGALENSVRDLPHRQSDLQALSREIDAALRELGPGWDRERVASFDTSAVTREMIDRAATALVQAEATVRDADQHAEAASDQARDAGERAEKALTALAAQPDPSQGEDEIAERLGLLRSARSTLNRLGVARNRRELLEGQATLLMTARTASQGPVPVVPLVLAVSALIVLGVGVAGGGSVLIVALAGAAGLLAAAGGVYLRVRSAVRGLDRVPTTVPGLEDARREEQELRAQAEQLAARLGARAMEFVALDEVEEALDLAVGQQDQRRAANAAADEAVAERERLIARHAAAVGEAVSANAALSEVRESWREWLTGHGLADTLAPGTALAVLGDIRTLRARLAAADDLEDRIAKIRADVEREGARVVRLAGLAGIALDTSDGQRLLRHCDDLLARYDAAAAADRERAQANDRAQESARRLKVSEGRLAAQRTAIGELLAAAGSDDEELFRELGRRDEERRRLSAALRECEGRLRVVSGPGEAFDRLLFALAATDGLAIEGAIHDLGEKRSRASSASQDIAQEIGATRTQLDQLRTDERATLFRAQRANLVEQLQKHATSWSRLIIARHLLDRAREKFERERQPEVVKQAQGYFQTITGGRYERIVAPVGEQRITVLPSDGASPRLPGQLSQGTQEQLYLAMRFGLIEQFARQGTALPVILDEILVNFDPLRATEAARALARLSDRHQALFFTCHPWVVELFRSLDAGVSLIDLDTVRPPIGRLLSA